MPARLTLPIRSDESVHPLWYGAKADGVTDDSAAIASAYAAAVASGKRLDLGGPTLSYLMNTPLVVSDSNVHIRGDQAKLINGSASQVVINVAGSSGGHLANVIIEGLRFNRAGGVASSANSHILATYVDNIIVANCRSDNAGLNGVVTNNCTDVTVAAVQCYSPHAFGIFCYQCTGVRWQGCVVDGAGNWGFQPKDTQNFSVIGCESRNCTEYGFYTWDDSLGAIRTTDGVFTACISHHNGKDGYYINAATRIVLDACLGHDNTWSGVSIPATSPGCKVIGGSYYLNGVSGIGSAGDRTTITGVNAYQNTQSGFELTAVKYCSVVGNVLTDNAWLNGSSAYSGIRVAGASTYNTIDGNTIIRTDSTNSKTAYGVDENSASCDHNVISSNAITGHATANIRRQGPNTIVVDRTPPTFARNGVKPSGAIAETIPRGSGWTAATQAGLVSGQANGWAIYLYQGETITSATFLSVGAAVGITNTWFALATSAGLQVAITADDGGNAWGANTVKTLAYTTPYVVPSDGVYYVVAMVAAGTVPTLAGASGSSFVTGISPKTAWRDTTNVGLANPASAPGTFAFTTTLGQLCYAYVS